MKKELTLDIINKVLNFTASKKDLSLCNSIIKNCVTLDLPLR